MPESDDPSPLSPEDAELDARWRAVFGQPLPIIGAADIARAVLDAAVKAGRAEAGLGPDGRPKTRPNTQR